MTHPSHGPRGGPAFVGALGLLALAGGGCVDIAQPRTVDPEVQAQVASALQSYEASQDPQDLVAASRLYRREGMLFEAAEVLRRAPDEADTPYLRAEKAQVYLALGMTEAVVRELKGCLREDSRQPDCLLGFAGLLASDANPGSLREARRVYAMYLEHAPADHPERARAEAALQDLGGPLAREGSAPVGLAERLPPEALSQPNPHGPGSPRGAPGRPPGSEAAPEPGEAPALNPFGQALAEALQAVREGDREGAEAGFRRALELKPDHPSTLASLAETEYSLGKADDAMAHIARAMELDPDDPQVRFLFGSIMLRAGVRVDEGTAAWQALLRDQPELAEQLGVRERLAALRRQGEGNQAARPGARGGAGGSR